MPDEQPVVSPDDRAVAEAASTQEAAVQSPPTAAYEPAEDEDEWLEEPVELPRRPRRRALTPVPLALMGVLLIACGFIGGVLVEKGQTSSSSASAGTASGLASRLGALRGSGSATAASGASASAGGPFAGRAGGAAGAGGATAGQVAYISGNTLYLTTAEGNTVKVTSSPATSVTKTVKASVSGIHPGETVTATGATGANGAITAESIRVGADAGGGLGALFSGSREGAGRKSGGGSTGGGGGEPALFGSGGG
jgi:hypothetical protein